MRKEDNTIMRKEDLASLINGREYREEITSEEQRIAKENGLVVCFGASDDLLKLKGAINEEFGAWDGETFTLCRTARGTIYWNDETNIPCEEFGCDRWKIEAVWCPPLETLTSWLVKSDIPHSQFNIYEEGELYCVGIVFDVNDL